MKALGMLLLCPSQPLLLNTFIKFFSWFFFFLSKDLSKCLTILSLTFLLPLYFNAPIEVNELKSEPHSRKCLKRLWCLSLWTGLAKMDSLFCLGISSIGICGTGALQSSDSVLGLYTSVKASWRSKAHVFVWFDQARDHGCVQVMLRDFFFFFKYVDC